MVSSLGPTNLDSLHSLAYREQLPESAYMHQLLGLNLLFLLSQNRVAEFHTELERLPAKDIQTNVYIKHPVSLEQVRLGRGWGPSLRWVLSSSDLGEGFLEEGSAVFNPPTSKTDVF